MQNMQNAKYRIQIIQDTEMMGKFAELIYNRLLHELVCRDSGG